MGDHSFLKTSYSSQMICWKQSQVHAISGYSGGGKARLFCQHFGATIDKKLDMIQWKVGRFEPPNHPHSVLRLPSSLISEVR